MEDIEIVGNENIVLDSLILGVSFTQDKDQIMTKAYVDLKPQTKKFQGIVRLKFSNIKEFYWNVGTEALYVERYKFIRNANDVYISLDPYDESSKTPSDQDNCVIWAETIKQELLDDTLDC